MSQELVYTSAPRGLKPGSRGFCSVAWTQGIPPQLVERLEALSGYRQVYAPQDPNAAINPVAYSHLRISAAGRQWQVVSRVAAAGLDYTQRTNKFAHHVALEPAEMPAAGPAWLLAAPGFMRANYAGEPAMLPTARPIPRGQSSPAVCRAWQAATGDAGWGGVLAQSALDVQPRPATIIFRAGMELLPLLAESLALLPPERRAAVTFCTYFTKLPPGVDCRWRGVLDGTPEAAAARRGAQGLVIDLCNPLPRAADSAFVEAARRGTTPASAGVGMPSLITAMQGASARPDVVDDDALLNELLPAADGVSSSPRGRPHLSSAEPESYELARPSLPSSGAVFARSFESENSFPDSPRRRRSRSLIVGVFLASLCVAAAVGWVVVSMRNSAEAAAVDKLIADFDQSRKDGQYENALKIADEFESKKYSDERFIPKERRQAINDEKAAAQAVRTIDALYKEKDFDGALTDLDNFDLRKIASDGPRPTVTRQQLCDAILQDVNGKINAKVKANDFDAATHELNNLEKYNKEHAITKFDAKTIRNRILTEEAKYAKGDLEKNRHAGKYVEASNDVTNKWSKLPPGLFDGKDELALINADKIETDNLKKMVDGFLADNKFKEAADKITDFEKGKDWATNNKVVIQLKTDLTSKKQPQEEFLAKARSFDYKKSDDELQKLLATNPKYPGIETEISNFRFHVLDRGFKTAVTLPAENQKSIIEAGDWKRLQGLNVAVLQDIPSPATIVAHRKDSDNSAWTLTLKGKLTPDQDLALLEPTPTGLQIVPLGDKYLAHKDRELYNCVLMLTANQFKPPRYIQLGPPKKLPAPLHLRLHEYEAKDAIAVPLPVDIQSLPRINDVKWAFHSEQSSFEFTLFPDARADVSKARSAGPKEWRLHLENRFDMKLIWNTSTKPRDLTVSFDCFLGTPAPCKSFTQCEDYLRKCKGELAAAQQVKDDLETNLKEPKPDQKDAHANWQKNKVKWQEQLGAAVKKLKTEEEVSKLASEVFGVLEKGVLTAVFTADVYDVQDDGTKGTNSGSRDVFEISPIPEGAHHPALKSANVIQTK